MTVNIILSRGECATLLEKLELYLALCVQAIQFPRYKYNLSPLL